MGSYEAELFRLYRSMLICLLNARREVRPNAWSALGTHILLLRTQHNGQALSAIYI